MYLAEALSFSPSLMYVAGVGLDREYVDTYLLYICCKIKYWIHRDTTSYKLIKKVHV
jgi:hypothetical protein